MRDGAGHATEAPPAGRPAAPPPGGAEAEAPGSTRDPGRWRRYAIAFGFLAPALVFLAVWIVYPTVSTIVRSLYGRRGDEFVGFDNYVTLFTTDLLLTAIRNSAVWVLVVPVLVTAIGLIFAVLTERIRWSVAFKTAVFMPMAISLFAAGIIWRIVYDRNPERGAANAAIATVHDVFSDTGILHGARPSTDAIEQLADGAVGPAAPLAPGDVALLGLTAIAPADVPDDAEPAVPPEPLRGGITGVVWRDFTPGGGEPGRVDEGELGLPGVDVELRDAAGRVVATVETDARGAFAFEELEQGPYGVAVAAAVFAEPFEGVSWLGPQLITPAIIIAYTWVWAGFAMVVIGAGLAAIPRDVLEAARTDGATEWQVFSRVTVPLLAPVLSVVFITMMINVLKVFDIVLSVAPASVQDDANVIALAMWRTSFGGVNDFGLGSAIAVLLFVLVIPILLLNIRRFRREA
ncbi:MAG TPA: ABC transporter permease subunit [Thermoleophilia bacterium]|nr:ABC transporter permease subunit [Thermoleophilia bacterium]